MLRVTSPRLFLWIHQGLKFPLPKIQTPQYLLGRQGLILQQLQHQGVMLTPTPLREPLSKMLKYWPWAKTYGKVT